MMKTNLKKWMPLVLCCMPAVAVAAVVGIGITVGGAAFSVSFVGSWGLGLLVLLICPLYMGWMMWRMQKHGATGEAAGMSACCSSNQNSIADLAPSDRLQALRTQRKMLEHELIELHGTRENQNYGL